MITKNDLRTGMKVSTREKGDYYVVLDWSYRHNDSDECTALLIKAGNNDKTTWLFHGILGYTDQLEYPANSEWDITNVYIYTGRYLDDMDDESAKDDWTEITEPIHYNQDQLTRYFSKFG